MESFQFENSITNKIDYIQFQNDEVINTKTAIVASTLPIDYNAKLFGLDTTLYFEIHLLNKYNYKRT